MQSFVTVVKALAIMLLAATGSAAIFSDMKASYNVGPGIFIGVFSLLGAFFLYRAWFARS